MQEALSEKDKEMQEALSEKGKEMQDLLQDKEMLPQRLESIINNPQDNDTAMIHHYVQGWPQQLEQRFPVLDLNSFMKPSVNDVAPAQIVSHNNKTWLNTTSIMKIKTPVYKK